LLHRESAGERRGALASCCRNPGWGGDLGLAAVVPWGGRGAGDISML
jgi:hypothetical protein